METRNPNNTRRCCHAWDAPATRPPKCHRPMQGLSQTSCRLPMCQQIVSALEAWHRDRDRVSEQSARGSEEMSLKWRLHALKKTDLRSPAWNHRGARREPKQYPRGSSRGTLPWCHRSLQRRSKSPTQKVVWTCRSCPQEAFESHCQARQPWGLWRNTQSATKYP